MILKKNLNGKNTTLQNMSHLKSRPVEGDVCHALDGAIVENIRYQEQSSYLFNCWGLKQVEV